MKNGKKMETKKTRILLMNFGGIGDEILFLPTIKSVKNTFRNSLITVAVESRSQSIKNLTDLIDETITCDIKGKDKYSNLLKFLFKVWTKRFDVVISSGSSEFIPIILFLTGIKKRIGFYTGLLSKIFLTKTAKLNLNQYAAKMYHELAIATDNKAVFDLPEVKLNPETTKWAQEQLQTNNKIPVAIHPGVSTLSIEKNIIKFWPAKKWAELIKVLLNCKKYTVVLLGGPDDEQTINQIRKELKQKEAPEDDLVDMFGKTQNITQLASLISLCEALISVDSAPMHIAVGLKKKVFALFGPTDDKKLLPVNCARYQAFKNENLNCRPCLWDKRQQSCDTKSCLDFSVQEVFEAFEKFLKDCKRLDL
jgi:putative inorganic carbon (hco3(-)) transporter